MLKKLSIILLVTVMYGNSSYSEEKVKELGRGYAHNILIKIESFERFESSKNCGKAILNDVSINTKANDIEKKRAMFYSDYFIKYPVNQEFTVKVFKECVLSLEEIKDIKIKYLKKVSI